MVDIIICGGGPVGSQVAYEIASRGYGVTVLEKRKNLREEVCCTGIISVECVKNFEIPESLIVRRFSSAKIFSPLRNALGISSPEPVACLIDRGSFDTFLSERAVESGAHLRCDAEAKNIVIKKNAVEVVFESNGRTERLEADAAVIASGATSTLSKGDRVIPANDIIMGVQSEVATSDLKDIEIYVGCTAPGSFAWLVPTSRGKALAGLLARSSAVACFDEFNEFLVREGKINDKGKTDFRPIALRTSTKTYGERVLVVGGAAGQVKPTTGGGIYYGLLAAKIAADVLSQASDNNDFSERSLSTYELRWKKMLGREMIFGRLLRKIYERLSEEQIDSLLNMIESSTVCESFWGSGEAFFDWHGKSAINLLKYSLKSLILAKN